MSDYFRYLIDSSTNTTQFYGTLLQEGIDKNDNVWLELQEVPIDEQVDIEGDDQVLQAGDQDPFPQWLGWKQAYAYYVDKQSLVEESEPKPKTRQEEHAEAF